MDYSKLYENCTLCPRRCGVNRLAGEVGYCMQTDRIRIARAALHYWEEPDISGTEEACVPGSGAVFFSGCNLRCVYCQNHDISALNNGYDITVSRLCEEFLRLQDEGAININLVTAVMHIPGILQALDMAREKGLTIPVVYNSSGYETVETIKLLEGYVDVYLPDFKYMSSELAAKLSNAPDYPRVAQTAIDEMFRQCMENGSDDNQTKKRMIVRHLVLPGHTKESKEIIKYLYDKYKDQIYISIMSQYTPIERILDDVAYPELKRRITEREYDKVVSYAINLGVNNAYVQDREVSLESFIPKFYTNDPQK